MADIHSPTFSMKFGLGRIVRVEPLDDHDQGVEGMSFRSSNLMSK